MTALWTASDVLMATGGSSHGPADWIASGVSIDTRTLKPGDLFVALQGPNHDGHDHLSAAAAGKAAAAIVANPVAEETVGLPQVRVADTQRALESLATHSRARMAGRVIGLTGSVGKTGTKEMLSRALGGQGLTYATEGNLNNHIGAPLSLARMARQTSFGVFELGMNHPDEIRPLTKLVRPHVAIITRIAPAHTAFFDSLDGIAAAKAEIFEGLEPGATAVINADDGYTAFMSDEAAKHGAETILTFGEAEAADVRLISASVSVNGTAVEAMFLGERLTYRVGATGKHWAMNSLAVLAALSAAGAQLDPALAALAEVRAPKGRGAAVALHLPVGSFTLIDESYNASPAAVRAAFAVLQAHTPAQSGRRIAVLGDMLELGAQAGAEHAALGRNLAALDVAHVFAVGPEARALFDALRPDQRAGWYPDSAAAAQPVADALTAGDVVLVKGSLGIRMSAIIERLRALGPLDTGACPGEDHAV